MTDLAEPTEALDGEARGSARSPYTRAFALEDISVRSDGGGRIVEAYAAIFNTPAPVRDQDGDYEEIIDPACFNRAIDRLNRSGKPLPVLFNHGKTIWGTPSERDGVPIGVAEEVRPDGRGLFTRARFHKTERADEVLEAIRERSINSYSFSGAFHRSEPLIPRGGFRRRSDGCLPTVRRTESTLREFGPATFAVYAGAEIVGVRAADQAAVLLAAMPVAERERLAEILLRSDTLERDLSELDTSATAEEVAEELAAGTLLEEHVTRSIKEQIEANRSEFNERLDIRKQLQANRARFTSRHGTTLKGNEDG